MTTSFTIVISPKEAIFRGQLKFRLPQPIELIGDWEVGLTTLSCAPAEETPHAWIFCDLVEYTYVVDGSAQFLDVMSTTEVKNGNPHYARVIKHRFSDINIEIKTSCKGNIYIETDKDVVCILHFQKA